MPATTDKMISSADVRHKIVREDTRPARLWYGTNRYVLVSKVVGQTAYLYCGRVSKTGGPKCAVTGRRLLESDREFVLIQGEHTCATKLMPKNGQGDSTQGEEDRESRKNAELEKEKELLESSVQAANESRVQEKRMLEQAMHDQYESLLRKNAELEKEKELLESSLQAANESRVQEKRMLEQAMHDQYESLLRKNTELEKEKELLESSQPRQDAVPNNYAAAVRRLLVQEEVPNQETIPVMQEPQSREVPPPQREVPPTPCQPEVIDILDSDEEDRGSDDSMIIID